jgi:hypothetical protein
MQYLLLLGFSKGSFAYFFPLVLHESEVQNVTFLLGLAKITKLPNNLEHKNYLSISKKAVGRENTLKSPLCFSLIVTV